LLNLEAQLFQARDSNGHPTRQAMEHFMCAFVALCIDWRKLGNATIQTQTFLFPRQDSIPQPEIPSSPQKRQPPSSIGLPMFEGDG
jgi:hypothetical protein